ncbi:hypothetical protein NM688_g7632 [Phlebia brevispora]|uniref:Uncharacterized protein n=1 Tax=Phlebia brevispora TaxID=194682 RepID=A0ACC1S371_9APHY|nr:hypothetical protein NM688_g7632 [Phlebia brevispora]
MEHSARVESTDLGPAIQVSLQYFVNHVLPPLRPQIDVDAVLRKLKRVKKGKRQPITKAGRWWGFAKDPARTPISIQRSYMHFPNLVRAIARHSTPRGEEPSLQIFHNPITALSINDRGETSMPDAYMAARGTSGVGMKWSNIDVIGEYGKSEHSELASTKMSWSVVRAFDDPRRRFVFGYTVENVTMRLWYFHRTEAIFSTGFNFVTDHRPVVHAFLSFLYAEPHQLGWDTTMQPVDDPKHGMQYDFTVDRSDGSSSVFRSLSLVFGGQSGTARRRGTRVWKVVEMADGVPRGEPLILKDSWNHEELSREGVNLERIRERDESTEFQNAFRTNFLTVVCHGNVLMRSTRGPSPLDCSQQHSRAYRQAASSKNAHPSAFYSSHKLSGRKIHYRIVFKEHCQPLTLTMPLGQVFTVLGEACQALKILHESGWVHRDVSIGNIMLDEASHARLVDLEYAKMMGDPAVPEFRVGTKPFMSSEVDAQTYWCGTLSKPPSIGTPSKSPSAASSEDTSPSGKPKDGENDSDDSSLPSIHKRALAIRAKFFARKGTPPTSGSPPVVSQAIPSPFAHSPTLSLRGIQFKYNPLHDLESLFWIVTFFLLKHPSTSAYIETRHQREIGDALLFNSNQHCRAIRLDGAWEQDLSTSQPPLQALTRILDAWRSKLTEAFYTAEKDCSSITSSAAAGLHDNFVQVMQEMSRVWNEQFASDAQSSRPKRRLEDAGDVDNNELSIRISGEIGESRASADKPKTVKRELYTIHEEPGEEGPEIGSSSANKEPQGNSRRTDDIGAQTTRHASTAKRRGAPATADDSEPTSRPAKRVKRVRASLSKLVRRRSPRLTPS